jgi:hypothetical protein
MLRKNVPEQEPSGSPRPHMEKMGSRAWERSPIRRKETLEDQSLRSLIQTTGATAARTILF